MVISTNLSAMDMDNANQDNANQKEAWDPMKQTRETCCGQQKLKI
jgi:hypothetical protein